MHVSELTRERTRQSQNSLSTLFLDLFRFAFFKRNKEQIKTSNVFNRSQQN